MPTATATQPLNTVGPWLLFHTAGNYAAGDLWALNADGTGLTRLVDENVIAYTVQPGSTVAGGGLVAYVSLSPGDQSRDLTLKILQLPSREVETVVLLLNDNGQDNPLDVYDATTSITSNGLVWSPDGSALAFVGQIDGPSMDAYVYDIASRTITRLSAGEHQAYQLRWSPDGGWLVLEAYAFAGMGDIETVGIWSSQKSGGGTVTIMDRDLSNDSIGQISYAGWLDRRHIALIDHHYDKPSTVISVSIDDGARRDLFSAVMSNAVYSPQHNVWLVNPCCPDSPQPISMFRDGNLADIGDYQRFSVIKWWEKYDAFMALTTGNLLYKISPSGEMSQVPLTSSVGNDILPSPDETLWAWVKDSFYDPSESLGVGDAMADSTKIFAEEQPGVRWKIEDETWSPDSQRLLVFTESDVWILARPDFEPVLTIKDGFYQPYPGLNLQWIP